MMGARHELPGVREIKILGNQEAGIPLRRSPYDLIWLAGKPLSRHGIDVMTQQRQIRSE